MAAPVIYIYIFILNPKSKTSPAPYPKPAAAKSVRRLANAPILSNGERRPVEPEVRLRQILQAALPQLGADETVEMPATPEVTDKAVIKTVLREKQCWVGKQLINPLAETNTAMLATTLVYVVTKNAASCSRPTCHRPSHASSQRHPTASPSAATAWSSPSPSCSTPRRHQQRRHS